MAQVTWSHSGLKDFEGCPRRYQEIILEQRGIIGFLEGKITKLTELLEEQ